jgi:hypothetical protein
MLFKIMLCPFSGPNKEVRSQYRKTWMVSWLPESVKDTISLLYNFISLGYVMTLAVCVGTKSNMNYDIGRLACCVKKQDHVTQSSLLACTGSEWLKRKLNYKQLMICRILILSRVVSTYYQGKLSLWVISNSSAILNLDTRWRKVACFTLLKLYPREIGPR